MPSKLAKLTIDSNEYLLLYDFNVLADCEDDAKCNLLEALTQQGRNTATQLRGLLYAFLKPRLPEVTIEEAAALVRADTIPPVLDAIAEAFILAASEEYVEAWRQQQEEVERLQQEAERKRLEAERKQQVAAQGQQADEAAEAGETSEEESDPTARRERPYPVRRATKAAGLLSPEKHKFAGDLHTKCKECGLAFSHPCHDQEEAVGA